MTSKYLTEDAVQRPAIFVNEKLAEAEEKGTLKFADTLPPFMFNPPRASISGDIGMAMMFVNMFTEQGYNVVGDDKGITLTHTVDDGKELNIHMTNADLYRFTYHAIVEFRRTASGYNERWLNSDFVVRVIMALENLCSESDIQHLSEVVKLE